MFLTPQKLKSMKPCASGYKYFLKNFPDGAEVMEILDDKNIPTEVVLWGLEKLALSEQEIARANEVLNNNNSSNFYCCSNLDDSEYITYGDFVNNSRFVHNSKHINDCQDVVNSEDINNSTQVFNSEFVVNSSKILQGRNVRDGHNVIGSTSIIESTNIYGSSNILGSSEIYKCQNITDSSFCANSNNLTNCLFCNNLQGAEYHIFNQPIDERRYRAFVEEYKKLMEGVLLSYVKSWPAEIISKFAPKDHIRWDKYYLSIPERLWKWAKTIPNYNKDILYTITLDPQFLI